MTTLFGWDASDFDHSRGPMDMASAAAAGISFYTHKATEGTNTQHHPGASLAAARDAGIPFLGAYIVPRSGPSVAAQVDYLLAWMDVQAPWWKTFPGWFWQVDTEKWSYDAVTAQRGHDVAQLLAQRTGRVVLHYAPEWAYGNGVPQGEALWASSYVSGTGTPAHLYPGDGSTHWHAYSGRVPAILQFTSSATIGRQSGCDANAFRGARADFARLIGSTTSPTGDDMAVFLAQRNSDGALFLCEGSSMRARQVTVGSLGDTVTLINEGLVAPIVGIGPGYGQAAPKGSAKIGDYFPRSGFTEAAFGPIDQQPAPATLVLTDAQLSALTAALIASEHNGLTDADHAGIKADLAAGLATLTLHAG